MEKAAAAKAAMEKASQAALCQETAATEEAGQAALPTAAKGTEAEKEAVAEKEALAETLPDALATDAAASLAVTLATPVASPVAVALPPGPSSGSAPAPHGDVQCCACREVTPRDQCTCVNKGRLTTKLHVLNGQTCPCQTHQMHELHLMGLLYIYIFDIRISHHANPSCYIKLMGSWAHGPHGPLGPMGSWTPWAPWAHDDDDDDDDDS